MDSAAMLAEGMTPPTQTTARRTDGAETRRDIVTTAHRLFTTIGYRKTTVADIASELSMSPANVYRFFDSKKSINEAVAERLLGEIVAELEEIAADASRPAAERLAAVMRRLAALSEERFMSNKRVYDMVEDAMAESWGVCAVYVERVSTLFGKLAEAGRRSGEFAVEDAEVAGLCLHSLMVCNSHPAIMAQNSEHRQATIDQIVAFALSALGARRS